MQKNWISLGLMSGTSGDGVDASIIKTNGINRYELIKNKYFEYDSGIYKDIHTLKEKIQKIDDLKVFKNEINILERKITIFHAKLIEELKIKDDAIIGFHGQTIYHNPDEKISRQLGNGKLLHQLTKKNVVFDFRRNDIQNGGQGAPLTPLFHHLLTKQNEIKLPVCFLNIGGISNITIVKDKDNLS
jgi:anhydro-N-acetylmuramic acid kinase